MGVTIPGIEHVFNDLSFMLRQDREIDLYFLRKTIEQHGRAGQGMADVQQRLCMYPALTTLPRTDQRGRCLYAMVAQIICQLVSCIISELPYFLDVSTYRLHNLTHCDISRKTDIKYRADFLYPPGQNTYYTAFTTHIYSFIIWLTVTR